MKAKLIRSTVGVLIWKFGSTDIICANSTDTDSWSDVTYQLMVVQHMLYNITTYAVVNICLLTNTTQWEAKSMIPLK